jgi:hypothetical protein
MTAPHDPIYQSEHCSVDTYTPHGPDKPTVWYIGDRHDSYDSPGWPSREAMIADLEAAVDALKHAETSP